MTAEAPQGPAEAERDPAEAFLLRWVGKPILIAVAAVAAVALLSTLAGLQNEFPSWAYSLPALFTAIGYYSLEGKKVYAVHFGLNSRASATASNGPAVNVQGKRNLTLVQMTSALDGQGQEQRFRSRHEEQLGPLMQELNDELSAVYRVIDAGSDWYTNEIRLTGLDARLASQRGMPGLGMAMGHATLFGFEVRLVRDCIQDVHAFLQIRDELTRSILRLVDEDPEPWDVNARTHPERLAAILLFHVILGGPDNVADIVALRGDDQGAALVVDGEEDVAAGNLLQVQGIRETLVAQLQTAVEQLTVTRGHAPDQSHLLDSLGYWRQYLRELFIGFAQWQAHGIREDRCQECRQRLPPAKPTTANPRSFQDV